MADSLDADLPLPLAIALPKNTRSARLPRWMRRLRRTSGRHPEWWILPVSAAAWTGMWIATPPAPAHVAPPRGIVPATLEMGMKIVAMMLPLTMSHTRAFARSTPWRGRHLRVAVFVTGYLALWIVAMGVIQAVWSLSAGITIPVVASGIAVAAAALWEMAPAKRRLHACDGARVLVTGGWKGCARSGVVAGGRCVGACWALMAVCAAFAHSPLVMAGLFALQLNGRFRRALPPAGAALALVGMWLAWLAMGTGGSHHH